MEDRDPEATTFNGTLIVTGEARSAFACLGAMLVKEGLVIPGLPVNYSNALKLAYIDAFWGGRGREEILKLFP